MSKDKSTSSSFLFSSILSDQQQYAIDAAVCDRFLLGYYSKMQIKLRITMTDILHWGLAPYCCKTTTFKDNTAMSESMFWSVNTNFLPRLPGWMDTKVTGRGNRTPLGLLKLDRRNVLSDCTSSPVIIDASPFLFPTMPERLFVEWDGVVTGGGVCSWDGG